MPQKTFYVRDTEIWQRAMDKAISEDKSLSGVIMDYLEGWVSESKSGADEKIERIKKILGE